MMPNFVLTVEKSYLDILKLILKKKIISFDDLYVKLHDKKCNEVWACMSCGHVPRYYHDKPWVRIGVCSCFDYYKQVSNKV